MKEENVNAEINFETGNIETGNATTGNVGYGNSTTGNVGNVGGSNYATASTGAPAKVSVWTKLKGFLLQDVSEIKLELTPGEQKFVNFWTQDVSVDKVYNFLFQEVKFK